MHIFFNKTQLLYLFFILIFQKVGIGFAKILESSVSLDINIYIKSRDSYSCFNTRYINKFLKILYINIFKNLLLVLDRYINKLDIYNSQSRNLLGCSIVLNKKNKKKFLWDFFLFFFHSLLLF